MFVHESRSSNKEAHNLARLLVSLPVGGHVWLIDLPDDIDIPHIFIKLKGCMLPKKN
jgi:hypothetical protein